VNDDRLSGYECPIESLLVLGDLGIDLGIGGHTSFFARNV